MSTAVNGMARGVAAAALSALMAAAWLSGAPAWAQDGSGAQGAAEAAVEGQPLEQRGYALGDIVLGDPEAPVEIIEYASLTCPHCATFHVGSLPELKEKYIDTGKARMIVREVYFDQFGLWAAMVARCGGPEKYHAYLDVFFEQQSEWARGSQEDVINGIRRIGRLGGLSAERVDACLSDQDYVTKLVEDYRAHAERDNVRSTPLFYINGEQVRGARSAAEMSEFIDAHLDG